MLLYLGMGAVKYPQYEIHRPSQVFAMREHLLLYEGASQLQTDLALAFDIKKNLEVNNVVLLCYFV